jgi:hypothetical protein
VSLEELLVPIEAPLVRSPPPAFDRPITEERKESCETRNKQAKATTSSGLGSPENRILMDVDCKGGDSEPGICPTLHPQREPRSRASKRQAGLASWLESTDPAAKISATFKSAIVAEPWAQLPKLPYLLNEKLST